MYKLVLILKYLRRKLAPMFAALAVTLCTAMVIIVISVMGGFLDLMRTSVKKLSSDVIVTGDLSGFAYYHEMAQKLVDKPQIEAAAPVMSTYGLVRYFDRVHTIEVLGIDPASFDKVTDYSQTLYWHGQDLQEIGGTREQKQYFGQLDPHAYGMTMQPPPQWLLDHPKARGAVPGIEVNPYSERGPGGRYDAHFAPLSVAITLTVVPVTQKGGLLEPAVHQLIVVNEFKSGLYEVDANQMYVPFDLLQQMLKMDAYAEVDPQSGEPTGRTVPARTSRMLVRGAPGVPLVEVKAAVQATVRQFAASHPDMQLPIVLTWQERYASLLNAVQNEKGLITFLFIIISVVAFVMVATTFYNIVLEKTSDIGVLRALGASRWGVANIFLGYGLGIGVVGSLLGLGLALLIVWNLNELNVWLCDSFHFCMWNPKTYYFDKVPEEVNPIEALTIVAGAIASSVMGSMIPAIVAARLDPVESLRYE